MKTVLEKHDKSKIKDTVMPVIMGVLFAFIISILLLISSSFIMTSNDTLSGLVQLFTCISIAGGSLAGGFVTARLYRNNGMILGMLTGLIFFIILLLTGAVMRQVGFNAFLFLKFILSLVFGGVGGVAGVNFRHKRARI